jgi:hypothetical protein
MAGEVILSVAYGIDIVAVDDPYLTLARKAVAYGSEAAVPGRFLVVSPILSQIHKTNSCAPGFHSDSQIRT